MTLVPADTPDGAGIVSVLAGETWRYQAWHRDTSGGAQTSNLTNAVGTFSMNVVVPIPGITFSTQAICFPCAPGVPLFTQAYDVVVI